jgi:hypothetical protein
MKQDVCTTKICNSSQQDLKFLADITKCLNELSVKPQGSSDKTLLLGNENKN